MTKKIRVMRAWAVVLYGKLQDIGLDKSEVFIDYPGERIIQVEIHPHKPRKRGKRIATAIRQQAKEGKA